MPCPCLYKQHKKTRQERLAFIPFTWYYVWVHTGPANKAGDERALSMELETILWSGSVITGTVFAIGKPKVMGLRFTQSGLTWISFEEVAINSQFKTRFETQQKFSVI